MSQTKPIFILGITYRSGTNFLYDLLKLHPDCEGVNPYEDFLIAHSDHLVRYINDTTSHWTASWGVDPAILERALSLGLMSVIVGQTTRPRPVTKTPSVRNLEMFFRFFPDAHLLILVRDGRSVVESGVTGFGWKYEPAMQQWAEAARIILRYRNNHQDTSCKSMLVRYEDLQLNPITEMQRILGFLELDPALYNFEAIKQLPIRGSSTMKDPKQNKVHWGKVEKDRAFNPLERWHHWPAERHDRFNWLAGDLMKQFEYELELPQTPALFSAVRNHWLDWTWWAGNKLKNVFAK